MSFNLEAVHDAMNRMIDAMHVSRAAGVDQVPLEALAAPLRGALPTPSRLWGVQVVIAPYLPPTDVWVRPGRVPSKAAGRKGTRRAWKRANPPQLRPIGRPRPVMAGGRLYVGKDDWSDLQRHIAATQPLYDARGIARTIGLGA